MTSQTIDGLFSLSRAIASATQLSTDKLIRRLCGPPWITWFQSEEKLLATIEVLGGRGDKRPAFLAALESLLTRKRSTVRVRCAAIDAIGVLGRNCLDRPPETVLASLASPEVSVQVAALRALGRLGSTASAAHERIRETVRRSLVSGESICVVWGSFALARTGDLSQGPFEALAVLLRADELEAAQKQVNAFKNLNEITAAAFVNSLRLDMQLHSLCFSYKSQIDPLLWCYPKGSHVRQAVEMAAAIGIFSTVSVKLEALRALSELDSLRGACISQDVKKLCESPCQELADLAERLVRSFSFTRATNG